MVVIADNMSFTVESQMNQRKKKKLFIQQVGGLVV